MLKLQRLLRLKRPKIPKKLAVWAGGGAAMPAPQAIKMAVLTRYGLSDATWIETGTFRGSTTKFLAQDLSIAAKSVISFEPSEKYFQLSQAALASIPNVRLLNASSESQLENEIAELKGPTCFWLDGHFSQGDTYAGSQDTPILLELDTITRFLDRLRPIRVFIDDVRLFVRQHHETDLPERAGYPPLRTLVEWAESNGFVWFIEHDIFVAWAD